MIRKPKIHFLIVLGMALLFSICSAAPASAADISSTSVANPYITIDPIGNHMVGEIFFINGTTNLPVSDNQSLLLIIHPKSYNPAGRGLSYTKYLAIVPGLNGIGQWSDNVTNLNWKPTEGYIAIIQSVNTNTSVFQVFTILPTNTGTISSHSSTQPPFQVTSTYPSLTQPATNTLPTPTPPTSLSLILSITALMGIVGLRLFTRKK